MNGTLWVIEYFKDGWWHTFTAACVTKKEALNDPRYNPDNKAGIPVVISKYVRDGRSTDLMALKEYRREHNDRRTKG